MFGPFSIGIWLRGLIALGILAGSGYLFYRWYDELPRTAPVVVETASNSDASEAVSQLTAVRELTAKERVLSWRPGWNEPTAYFAIASLLLAWSLVGGWGYPRLLRRSSDKEPSTRRTGEARTIARPDGTVLRVECLGNPDAPRLILIHGWGCDSTQWHYVKNGFAKQYRVVVWDLPGLGHSTPPKNRDFSLEKMAADLRAVVTATGDEPAILVGHSIGGMTILTFCRLFPELLGSTVAGLALVNTTYVNPLHTMRFSGVATALQKPIIEPLLHLTVLLWPLVWLMNWLSYLNGSVHRSTERQSFAGTETKGQLDLAARYAVQASPAVYARGCLGMLRYDATNVLERIPIPTLVVVGNRDPVTKPDAGELMRNSIPDAVQIKLDPAKHLGLLEHHETFSQKLKEFAVKTFLTVGDVIASARH